MKRIFPHFFPITLLACASVLAAGLVGCEISEGNKGAANPNGKLDRIAPVETTTCWIESVEQTLSISTDLEARDSVDLTARVSGVVTEVLADEGTPVTEGSLILRLDPADLDLALREAEVLLAEATSLLATAELARMEVESGADLAGVALDRASAERQRLESLFDADGRRLASEETLEESRFAEKEAEINLKKSSLALEKMDMTIAIEKHGMDKAGLAVERAQLDRSRSDIVSPIEGRVQMVELRPGELVTSGTLVATVIRSQPLLAWVRVPQSRLSELRVGLKAIITSDTARGTSFDGTVTAISPAVTSSEGTVRVRVEVEDPYNLLRPGAFSTCTLVLGTHVNALLVPKNARIFEGNRSVLFIVRDGQAMRVEIEPGLQTEKNLEVLSSVPPISVDDRIVIRGQARLRDGDLVEDVSIEVETIVEEHPRAAEEEGRG
jgi:RND family efflux transporter MFP subunit